MFEVVPTPTFQRDVKRLARKKFPLEELKIVVDLLAEGGHENELRRKYFDHQLSSSSQWKNHRELHIDGKTGDWLLIYKLLEKELVLSLVRTGNHKKLLGK